MPISCNMSDKSDNNLAILQPSPKQRGTHAICVGLSLLITIAALGLAALAYYELRELKGRVSELERQCSADPKKQQLKTNSGDSGVGFHTSAETRQEVVWPEEIGQSLQVQKVEDVINAIIRRGKRSSNRDDEERPEKDNKRSSSEQAARSGKKKEKKKKNKGEKGDTGPRGQTGLNGADGEKGEKGEKGDSFTMVAAHFQGSYEKAISSGVETGRNNGEIRVPDGKLKWWQKADWVDEHYFNLNDDGDIIVTEGGYYFIYSQVVYYDEAAFVGHAVNVNNMKHFMCSESTVSKDRKYNTCFTGGIASLQPRDLLSIKILYENRTILLQSSTTFIGLFKLS